MEQAEQTRWKKWNFILRRYFKIEKNMMLLRLKLSLFIFLILGNFDFSIYDSLMKRADEYSTGVLIWKTRYIYMLYVPCYIVVAY